MTLKDIPILGALAGDGVKTSEGVGIAGIFGWALAGPLDLAKAIAVAGLAVGVGLYALARNHAKAAAAVLLMLLATGCAAAGAGAEAGQQTRSQGAGLWNSDRVDIHSLTVNVNAFPSGMESWSPEQITALVAAKATGGTASMGNLLSGFGGQVTPNTSQAATGGSAEGGRGAGNPVLSTDPGTVGGLAEALGKYLGTTNTPPPAKKPETEDGQ